MSVPPTSVEAKRPFSAAGVLCMKMYSQLDDSMLVTLCFSRARTVGTSRPRIIHLTTRCYEHNAVVMSLVACSLIVFVTLSNIGLYL